MAEAALSTRIRQFRPSRSTARGTSLLVGAEILLVSTYAFLRAGTITNPLVLVYPFVWIDVSLLAVATTDPGTGSARQRLMGFAIAAGYFAVLGSVGGLFGPGSETVSLHVDWLLPPGYGPALLYNGSLLRLVLEPYKVTGYLALSYLVYATVLDTAGVAISGVVGLFSCVSCTWPILGTLTTSLFGSASAVSVFVLSQSYALGTLVFLSAVALLYYRPLR